MEAPRVYSPLGRIRVRIRFVSANGNAYTLDGDSDEYGVMAYSIYGKNGSRALPDFRPVEQLLPELVDLERPDDIDPDRRRSAVKASVKEFAEACVKAVEAAGHEQVELAFCRFISTTII